MFLATSVYITRGSSGCIYVMLMFKFSPLRALRHPGLLQPSINHMFCKFNHLYHTRIYFKLCYYFDLEFCWHNFPGRTKHVCKLRWRSIISKLEKSLIKIQSMQNGTHIHVQVNTVNENCCSTTMKQRDMMIPHTRYIFSKSY